MSSEGVLSVIVDRQKVVVKKVHMEVDNRRTLEVKTYEVTGGELKLIKVETSIETLEWVRS